MTEVAIVLGALVAFCLIIFGVARLVAMWMGAGPRRLQGSRGGRGNRR
jgi:hypothetical protein